MNRWTLLRHEKIIDKTLDIHYDFLLENEKYCKTWKLQIFPELDGESVGIFEHSNHRLIWLTIESNKFSIILKGKLTYGLFKKNADSCQLFSLNE